MTTRKELGVAVIALLFAGGCARPAKVNSAHVADPGTHVVVSPGALTVVQLGAGSPRTCTLKTGAPPGAIAGHAPRHGAGRQPGAHGRAHPPPGVGPGPGPGPGGGPGATLDTLLFRLCEARANNDISAEQYHSSVQAILKTMSDMALRMPAPGMGGRPGAGMGPGMRGPGMRRGWTDDDDRPWRGRFRGPDRNDADDESPPEKPEQADNPGGKTPPPAVKPPPAKPPPAKPPLVKPDAPKR